MEKLDKIDPEPKTKTVSHAVFKALQYGALTIQEMVTHSTEYTEEQKHAQLEEAYKRLKKAGVLY